MINLDEDKTYFILQDMQGGTWGGGRIFESIEEVGEQFAEWAEVDDMEMPEKVKCNNCDWTGVHNDLTPSDEVNPILQEGYEHELCPRCELNSKGKIADLEQKMPANIQGCLGIWDMQLWKFDGTRFISVGENGYSGEDKKLLKFII